MPGTRAPALLCLRDGLRWLVGCYVGGSIRLVDDRPQCATTYARHQLPTGERFGTNERKRGFFSLFFLGLNFYFLFKSSWFLPTAINFFQKIAFLVKRFFIDYQCNKNRQNLSKSIFFLSFFLEQQSSFFIWMWTLSL